MKVGLIARSEDRGLGNLTWEWARHMRPERVLLIHPNYPLARHDERFSEFSSWVVGWGKSGTPLFTNESTVRDFLHGLDVVYSAETFYDWRICDWARDAGCATVCHVMPEYFRHASDPHLPQPDAWWLPTGWRQSRLPASARVVPVPVPLDRWPTVTPAHKGPPRWLHVAGTPAAADRNGTRPLLVALKLLRRGHHVTLHTQTPVLQAPVGGRVKLDVRDSSTRDYWTMYGDHDALVLPRRYGGLTMPALEAMGAGLALVMPNIEPQVSEWPIVGYPAKCRGTINTIGGEIALYETDPRVLAETLDVLAACPDDLMMARLRAREWAERMSWAELTPLVLEELERACST